MRPRDSQMKSPTADIMREHISLVDKLRFAGKCDKHDSCDFNMYWSWAGWRILKIGKFIAYLRSHNEDNEEILDLLYGLLRMKFVNLNKNKAPYIYWPF
jgi:hypothetical protein